MIALRGDGVAILALAALLFGLLLHACGDRGWRVAETQETLTVRTPDYQVVVEKSPPALEVVRGGRTVLRAVPGREEGGFHIGRGGETWPLSRVTSYAETDSGLVLEAECSGFGPGAVIELGFHSDRLSLKIVPGDGGGANRIGIAFNLALGGHWYGGICNSGHIWPLETGEVVLDPFVASHNHASPIWLSSSGTGVFLPTYEPFRAALNENGSGLLALEMKSAPELSLEILVGADIREAFLTFVHRVGLPKRLPDPALFTSAQFNSWMEFGLRPGADQEKFIDYLTGIRKHDIACEVVILDERWTANYGDLAFDPARFPDPEEMVDVAHRLGFKLAVWVITFVDTTARNYPLLEEREWLVTDSATGEPALFDWWDGPSAQIDLSNPVAFDWFRGELEAFMEKYGVDGYKLDGGDAHFAMPELRVPWAAWGPNSFRLIAEPSGKNPVDWAVPITPNRFTDLWVKIGVEFPLHEYRVAYLSQSEGVVARLLDKHHSWDRANGLGAIIPHALNLSLIGYPFLCPDMIGGGLYSSMHDPGTILDEELFIRWIEASSLFPMMQFGYAPWRFSEVAVELAARYAGLHRKFDDQIWRLAREARRTGLPIIRPLFLRNPEDRATYAVWDQFLLGDDILVAPVLEKGVSARDVYLPAGKWRDYYDGRVFDGERTVGAYPAPLEKLPIFIAVEP